MKIIDEIERKIDSKEDGIDFRMILFNEGRYEKEQLRTVVKNVGVRIEIENRLFDPFKIENFYLGVLVNKKLKNLYTSSSFVDQFPQHMYPGEIIALFFYGDDIKEKFQKYKKEQGLFIIATSNGKIAKCSSKFDGDEIEKDIILLEDNEYTNWGAKKFCLFDIESTIT